MSLPAQSEAPPSDEKAKGASIVELDALKSRIPNIQLKALMFDSGVLYLNETFRGQEAAYLVEWTREQMGTRTIRQVPSAVIEGFLNSEKLVVEETIHNFSDQQVKREVGELARAVARQNGTDIHFLPGDNGFEVRYRRNRDLYALEGYTAEFAEKMMYAAHVAAHDSEPSYLPKHYQQARILPEDIGGVPGYEAIRVQYSPTSDGRAMFWRMQRPLLETYKSLEGLHYKPRQIRVIKRAISNGKGACLVAAPTNAGKTTLLGMTAMTKLQLEGRLNGVCFEDPPEYKLPLVQMSINAGDDPDQIRIENLKALAAINRMDPDFVYMGEIRGNEAGDTMVRAASAHPTFGGFHAENSFEALPQLVRMGIDKDDIYNHYIIRFLFTQRLVQVLCPDCSEPVTTQHIGSSEALSNIVEHGVKAEDMRRRGRGCATCSNTGVVGMRPLIETVETSRDYMAAIRDRDIVTVNALLAANDCVSLADEGLAAVASGQCDGENLIKELGRISPEDVRYQGDVKDLI